MYITMATHLTSGPTNFSAIVKAKRKAVPGARLVITLSLTTTLSSE